MAVIDELLVGLGFDYHPEDLKDFKDDIAKTTGVIRNLAAVAVAGAAAITGLTVASTRASDEQGKLADEVGDTVERVDALQFALERSGGSADGMSNSLRSLAIRASEAARGVGGGLEAFNLLGISTSDTNGNLKRTSDLMLEVSGRLQGLSRAQQIELAEKLGLSDSIRLLQQGPDAIRELISEAQELGVTTAEDAQIAADFQNSLTNQFKVIKDISRALSREFVPILKETTDKFVEWWKANRDLVQQKLPEWIDKATMALKLLVIATAAWLAIRLIGHISALITLFKSLSITALAANAAVMLLPALIAAAVAGLALLIEDIMTFLEGGESFIGDLVKEFPILEDVILAVVDVLKLLGEVAMSAWDIIAALVDGAIQGFRALGQVITSVWEGINNFIDTVVNKIDQMVEKISGIWDMIPSLDDISFSGAVDSAGNFFSSLNPFADNNTVPELAPVSNSNSTSTNVDKIEISVTGAGDPDAVAESVFNKFQQSTQDLNSVVDM